MLSAGFEHAIPANQAAAETARPPGSASLIGKLFLIKGRVNERL